MITRDYPMSGIGRQATAQLRWVRSDIPPLNQGMVLQQLHRITIYAGGVPTSVTIEWHDVPTVEAL